MHSTVSGMIIKCVCVCVFWEGWGGDGRRHLTPLVNFSKKSKYLWPHAVSVNQTLNTEGRLLGYNVKLNQDNRRSILYFILPIGNPFLNKRQKFDYL